MSTGPYRIHAWEGGGLRTVCGLSAGELLDREEPFKAGLVPEPEPRILDCASCLPRLGAADAVGSEP